MNPRQRHTGLEPQRILILDGHPDPEPERFVHALAAAYGQGAARAGHIVHRLRLADMDIRPLKRRRDWISAETCEAARTFQDELVWANHVVVIFPLWLGSAPARLKALFEQTFRPAFAFGDQAGVRTGSPLRGRSARVIVTMGMPALLYRTIFFSHSLQALKRGVLMTAGLGPVRNTLFGSIESRRDRTQLLKRMQTMGARRA